MVEGVIVLGFYVRELGSIYLGCSPCSEIAVITGTGGGYLINGGGMGRGELGRGGGERAVKVTVRMGG
jgi:hypothetical protein